MSIYRSFTIFLLAKALSVSFLFPLQAQSPESFSYQAVARDGNGVMLTNQIVSFRFTIVQDDPVTGPNVWSERQVATTDQFGIAHINIGTGTLLGGNFSTIDWGDGPFFLWIELDETGGTGYEMMGFSQLLSVPYAMYANTAGNVDGSETRITAGTLINVTGTGTIADPYVISSTVDGSETKITAGDNVTITGSGTTGSPYQVSASMVEADPDFDASPAKGISSANINNWNDKQDQLTAGSGINISNNIVSLSAQAAHKFYLGLDTLGGIVFHIYLDEYGAQRGLIVSKVQGFATWQSPTSLVGADRQDDGPYNYGLMTSSPAKNWIVANYGEGWYLPSIDEFALLFVNRRIVNQALADDGKPVLFDANDHWTSTEASSSNAFAYSLGNGNINNTSKTFSRYIRAFRAF